MKGKLLLLVVAVILAACGGEAEEETKSTRANNPLATQQQAIRNAEKLQSKLDEDGEEKQKRLDEVMGKDK
ncbi:MAG: hypothetical protein U5O39_06815 [Gammaproteobacteria bacterium]|nr:hypothetical protein [Gammaproteobacteria bacterium]